jgi:hypothetical protein
MTKLLIFAALLFPIPSTIGKADCVCVKERQRSPEKVQADRRRAYDEAAAVFAGKVIALDAYAVRFRVEKRWKGEAQDEIRLSTGAVPGIDGTPLPQECSYQFRLGEKYLVYAYGAGEKLKTDICSTFVAKDAVEEEKGLDEIRAHETVK